MSNVFLVCFSGFRPQRFKICFLNFLFFAKTHFDLILSHGLEEFSNGCPDLYNAAGKL